MKQNSDGDSVIEDYCLEILFEELENLPEALIDEQLNNSSESELDSLASSDSLTACVSMIQPGDDLLYMDFDENSGDQCCYCLPYFGFFAILAIFFLISFLILLRLYFII